MQEKVIEAIVALAGVRWMQAEEIQLVVLPRGAMVPDGGYIPDWHAWNAQIRLGGGKWGELVGEGKTPEEAVESLLKSLVTAHKAVDERREQVLEFVPWNKRKCTTREESNRRTRDRTLQQAIQLVAKVKTLEEAEDILHKMLTGAIPAPKASTTEVDPEQQFNAAPTRVVSHDGKEVGVVFEGPATGEGMRYEKPQYTESDVAVREIAQLVGLSCPVSSPREVTEAVNKMQHEHHARIRELRESSIEWEASDFRAWMLNLANALGLPDAKDKSAILARAWEVGGTIGNTTPHASRGTSDAYQRLGARLVSRIPESLRRMTYERPNDAWQTESPRSLLKRISEETDHVLSCMLSGKYAEDVWSQLADIAAAAFIVGDSYEAKRWAPTSTDGSGL